MQTLANKHIMETKNCQNCKKDFVIDADDSSFYQKMNVPHPTFCHLCRAQRRFAFRNERLLHKTKSALSGKDIFTAYNPASGVQSYEIDEWHSDAWDPMDYGEDVDFTKPFFQQFKEFIRKVPVKNRNVVMGSNSPYCNNATDPKNCYLIFNSSFTEDSLYCNGLYNSRECIDCSHTHESEGCYQCFWVTSCHNCAHCSYCESSLNMWFSKNCVGCNDCFGCVGLRKKSYCIWNEQYTKEDYFKKLEEFGLDSRENIEKIKLEAVTFWQKFPNKFLIGTHNKDVSGSYVSHSKNAKDSFLIRECEDIRYCQYLEETVGTKDSYDFSIWGDNCQQVYETHASGCGIQNVKFCTFTQEDSRDIEYSMVCSGSSDLFACLSLRKKQYCIFNKQYTKEEFFTLRAKIIEHMNTMPYIDARGREYRYGEFFPIEISPFAYNETLAQEYFPLTKEEAVNEGYVWHDAAERNYQPTQTKETLIDSINAVDDSITKEIIACENNGSRSLCTTAFRVVADELTFYKKHGLPIPTKCPNCRTFDRLDQRLGLELWERQCACAGDTDTNGVYTNQAPHHHHEGAPCSNTFQTAYDPSKPDIVYCEQCYQQEVA